MSHTFTVPRLSVRVWGNRCATLEQEMLSLAGSVDGQYLCGEQDGRRQDKVGSKSRTVSAVAGQSRQCA
jgi:hypothetical protein